MPAGGGVTWGMTMMRDAQWIYLYGRLGTSRYYVARTEPAHLLDGRWQFHTVTGWSSSSAGLRAMSFTSSTKGSLFALARYRTDGSLDPGFGTAGLASADLGATFNSELVRALAIQADGGIVAVGDVSDGTVRSGIARFLP